MQAALENRDRNHGNHFEETLSHLLPFYGLKEVYRAATIGERQESVAEHVGSMLNLACWFIRTYNLELNLYRVVQMICIHDLHELLSGDTPIIPGVDNARDKEQRELSASQELASGMSESERKNYLELLAEYKAGLTAEAKFVRAIDKLDADLQFLNKKEAWATWTEEFYRSKREAYYREVPEIFSFYQGLLNYLRTNEYFKKNME